MHKQALGYLKRIIKPGKTEKQIALQLESFIRQKKCCFSFDPIIAGGPNSSLPHAPLTSRKIRKNDIVLVDIGIDYQGYKSDLTRIFFLGKIPNPVRDGMCHVREAQRLSIAKMKPGVAVSQIDDQARNYLKKKKLARYFTHSLGHGVGLEVHELPRLSAKDPSVLQEGMVITVEPAVYIPKRFGIRIEDMVLITKKGCEVISDDIN